MCVVQEMEVVGSFLVEIQTHLQDLYFDVPAVRNSFLSPGLTFWSQSD